MPRLNKIVSSIVLICFVFNSTVSDYALALDPGKISTGGLRPSSSAEAARDAMYEAGEKLWSMRKGAGGINFSDYIRVHMGTSAETGAKWEFVDVDETNYVSRLGGDPIYNETSFVDAAQVMLTRLGATSIKVTIGSPTLFKRGELARVAGDTVLLHPEFVDAWDRLRADDIWFEYNIGSERRTESAAWVVFYNVFARSAAGSVKDAGEIVGDEDSQKFAAIFLVAALGHLRGKGEPANMESVGSSSPWAIDPNSVPGLIASKKVREVIRALNSLWAAIEGFTTGSADEKAAAQRQLHEICIMIGSTDGGWGKVRDNPLYVAMLNDRLKDHLEKNYVFAAKSESPGIESERGSLVYLRGIKSSRAPAVSVSLTTLQDILSLDGEGRLQNVDKFLASVDAAEGSGAVSDHIDIFDNNYVETKGEGNRKIFTPALVGTVAARGKVPQDVHLMVLPSTLGGVDGFKKYISEFIERGASFVSIHWGAFLRHGFTAAELIDVLDHIRLRGACAGLAFNPEDNEGVMDINRFAGHTDFALIMTVEPGDGGKPFDQRGLENLAALVRLGYKGLIEVDGAIKEDTVSEVTKRGAKWLVSGSYVLGNVKKGLKSPEEARHAVDMLTNAAMIAMAQDYVKSGAVTELKRETERELSEMRYDYINKTHKTSPERFRELTRLIGMRLAKKASEAVGSENAVLVLPWRASLGLALPFAHRFSRFDHIGLSRDEKTHEPSEYYSNLKNIESTPDAKVVIADPMLATGGSIIYTIEMLLAKGVKEENITIASVLSAPEGIVGILSRHPRVRIITGSIDERLDANAYIVPGLGDFGDRYFEDIPDGLIKTWSMTRILDAADLAALYKRMGRDVKTEAPDIESPSPSAYKGPAGLFKILAAYHYPTLTITAPQALDLYRAHYAEFSLEAPVSNREKATDIMRGYLYENVNSIMGSGLLKRTAHRGDRGEVELEYTDLGKSQAISIGREHLAARVNGDRHMIKQLGVLAGQARGGGRQSEIASGILRSIARSYPLSEIAARAYIILLEAGKDRAYVSGKLRELQLVITAGPVANAIKSALEANAPGQMELFQLAKSESPNAEAEESDWRVRIIRKIPASKLSMDESLRVEVVLKVLTVNRAKSAPGVIRFAEDTADEIISNHEYDISVADRSAQDDAGAPFVATGKLESPNVSGDVGLNENVFRDKLSMYKAASQAVEKESREDKDSQKTLDAKNAVSFAREELWLESKALNVASTSDIKDGDILCNIRSKEVFEYDASAAALHKAKSETGDLVVLRPLSLTKEERAKRDRLVAKLRSGDRDLAGRMEAVRGLKEMVDNGTLPKPVEVDDAFQHCHSTYSHSPGNTAAYIAWKGYVLGLQVTGIVDHDTVLGFKEFRDAAAILGLRNPASGYEQRVTAKGTPFEFMTTNSPGNKGETYVAFHGVSRDRHAIQEERVVPAKIKRFEKTAEFINGLRVIPGKQLNYKEHIEPLTEAGNPTEKHVSEALARLIYESFASDIQKGGWDGVVSCANALISACSKNAGIEKDLSIKSEKDMAEVRDLTKFTFLIRNRVVTIAKQIPELAPTIEEVVSDVELYEDAHKHGELVYYCYLGRNKCEAEDRTVMSHEAKSFFIEKMKATNTALPGSIIDWWLAKTDASMLHLWFAYQKYAGADGIAFMPNRNSPEEVEDVIKIARECGFAHIANGMDVNTPDMPFTYFDYSNRPEFVIESLFIVEHENMARAGSSVGKTESPDVETKSPIVSNAISPENLETLIRQHTDPDEELSAPMLSELYNRHWKGMGFEKPAKIKEHALRAIQRGLYSGPRSLLKQIKVVELAFRGVSGERLFIYAAGTAAIMNYGAELEGDDKIAVLRKYAAVYGAKVGKGQEDIDPDAYTVTYAGPARYMITDEIGAGGYLSGKGGKWTFELFGQKGPAADSKTESPDMSSDAVAVKDESGVRMVLPEIKRYLLDYYANNINEPLQSVLGRERDITIAFSDDRRYNYELSDSSTGRSWGCRVEDLGSVVIWSSLDGEGTAAKTESPDIEADGGYFTDAFGEALLDLSDVIESIKSKARTASGKASGLPAVLKSILSEKRALEGRIKQQMVASITRKCKVKDYPIEGDIIVENVKPGNESVFICTYCAYPPNPGGLSVEERKRMGLQTEPVIGGASFALNTIFDNPSVLFDDETMIEFNTFVSPSGDKYMRKLLGELKALVAKAASTVGKTESPNMEAKRKSPGADSGYEKTAVIDRFEIKVRKQETLSGRGIGEILRNHCEIYDLRGDRKTPIYECDIDQTWQIDIPYIERMFIGQIDGDWWFQVSESHIRVNLSELVGTKEPKRESPDMEDGNTAPKRWVDPATGRTFSADDMTFEEMLGTLHMPSERDDDVSILTASGDPAKSLPEAITEYVNRVTSRLGEEAVPQLVAQDKERIFKAVEQLQAAKMKIFMPQRVSVDGQTQRFKLEQPVIDTLKNIQSNVRSKGGLFTWGEYTDRNNLDTLLVAEDGVLKVVMTDEESSGEVAALLASNPGRFKNVRIYNMAMPSGFSSMKTLGKSVCQIRALTDAIFIRLYRGDGSEQDLVIQTILDEMLNGRLLDGVDKSTFINNIPEKADETDAARQERLGKFLSWRVSLVELLGKQLRLLEKFVWSAA